MMAEDRAETTREPINYGRFMNQFPPDTINSDAATRKDKCKSLETNDVYFV